jgi:hypothetical protein
MKRKTIKKLKRTVKRRFGNIVLPKMTSVLITTVVVVGLVAAIALMPDIIINQNTYGNTNSRTWSTTTTTTTTTTTPVIPQKYTWKAMWIWEPLGPAVRPTWIMVGAFHDAEPSNVIDSVFMDNPSQWYVGQGGAQFDIGTTFRIYIGDPMNDVWDFTLDGNAYKIVSPGFVSYRWGLMQFNTDCYGHLLFEWVEV